MIFLSEFSHTTLPIPFYSSPFSFSLAPSPFLAYHLFKFPLLPASHRHTSTKATRKHCRPLLLPPSRSSHALKVLCRPSMTSAFSLSSLLLPSGPEGRSRSRLEYPSGAREARCDQEPLSESSRATKSYLNGSYRAPRHNGSYYSFTVIKQRTV